MNDVCVKQEASLPYPYSEPPTAVTTCAAPRYHGPFGASTQSVAFNKFWRRRVLRQLEPNRRSQRQTSTNTRRPSSPSPAPSPAPSFRLAPRSTRPLAYRHGTVTLAHRRLALHSSSSRPRQQPPLALDPEPVKKRFRALPPALFIPVIPYRWLIFSDRYRDDVRLSALPTTVLAITTTSSTEYC